MITVELSPEAEARLAAEAQARGVEVSEYAARLLEGALTVPDAETRRRTREEFDAFVRAMAEGSENLPEIPTEKFTRESFYEGRE